MMNNKITDLAVKLVSLIWLNLLWLICSLPLVTIGASTTALYYTLMRLARDEEGYLMKDFFTAFRQNFGKATKIMLIFVFVSLVCLADFFYLGQTDSPLLRILAFFILGLYLLFYLISLYTLPLTAQFEASLKETFISAAIIAFQHFHWTICLAIIHTLLPLLILFRFLPLIIFGAALPLFVETCILNRIFKHYLPRQQFTPGTIAKVPPSRQKG